MADKKTIPNVFDYTDSTGISIDRNSFENAWNEVFNTPNYSDVYDLNILKEYPSISYPDISLYDSSLSSSRDIVPYIMVEDYKQYLKSSFSSDNTYSNTFTSFFENLSSSSTNDNFDFSISDLDISPFMFCAAALIVSLCSVWVVKKAIRLYK